jgi:thiosulfate/3-mercaptopyruvate sulfurtransferase
MNKQPQSRRIFFMFVMIVLVTLAMSSSARLWLKGQSEKPAPPRANSAETLPDSVLVQSEELNKLLQLPSGEKPLVLQIGFNVQYKQAHIPGALYAGPTSKDEGLQLLRKRLESVPRNRFIVLYCGCCPWDHCPNVKPGYDEIRKMGFTKIKVLHVASNFGTDWVDKGYSVEK